MRVLLINEVCGTGSTGRICVDIAKEYEAKGDTVKIAFGRNINVPEECEKYAVPIGNKPNVYWHVFMTRLFDRHGLASKMATKRFLKWADEYNPDLLWLHNIHGYYINYEILFAWIKSRPDMRVKWTLHDCWAFTGHCVHFTYVRCSKWKDGSCSSCPERKQYPKSVLVDNSANNVRRKKKSFTDVKDMTIITPSNWLAKLVKESFLKDYPVEVRHNTIDTSVFKPTQSDFRERYGLQDKKIILGVANNWELRKGFEDFIELAKRIDGNWIIVLVGDLNKKQISMLPDNIIAYGRTDNQRELAEIYSAADVYVNTSLEEAFGLTTIEAVACGTLPVVYRGTACEEVALNNHGCVVDAGDIEGILRITLYENSISV